VIFKLTDMKKVKGLYIILTIALVVGCKQEPIVPSPVPAPPAEPTPSKGNADFTKFVAVGNSFVAGVQAGALFTEGQKNSLPAIMAKQFATVGGGSFTQASINATLGYNLFITPNPGTDNRVLGRLLLQYGTTPDCGTGVVSPKPTAQKYALGNVEAIPNPGVNPAFIVNGLKPTLNNFGVPAIVLGQSLISQTGNWSVAGSDPRFSPFYGRLAYPGNGTATLIGDVAGSGATFFMFWLGLDDFFLYAAFGGDPTKAPLTPATGGLPNGFDGQYAAAVGSILGANANLKGVVGNYPDIFTMPHFTSVTYNPIPLDASTANAVSSGFAGYNAALDGLLANQAAFGISPALATEIGTRKVNFAAGCSNKILMTDETLTNLGPYFDGLKNAGAITQAQRDALNPYVMVRQTTATDIIPLSTGSVLGTLVGGNPSLVNGVTVPLGDQYVLIPTEITAIKNARDSYNATVAAFVAANSSRLALADVNAGLAALVTAKAGVSNGITITPNINPPTGIYSEDGVHPNSRGYAFLANIFIDAINAKFAAAVPKANLAEYPATGLPINP
jgi:hypothetical protein